MKISENELTCIILYKKRESGANGCSWNIGSEKKVDTADVQRGEMMNKVANSVYRAIELDTFR